MQNYIKVYNRDDELIDDITLSQAHMLAKTGSGSFHQKDDEMIMILWVDEAILSDF